MSAGLSSNDDKLRTKLAANERVLQIITFALCSGCLAFAGVAFSQNTHGFNLNFEGLVPIMALIGGVMLTASFLVPPLLPLRQMVNSMLRGVKANQIPSLGDPEADLANAVSGALTTKHVIACALAEGGAFANLFAFMQSGSLVSLGVAGLSLLAIMIRMPLPGSHVERSFRERDRLLNEPA